MNDVFNSLFSFQIIKAVGIYYGNLENVGKTKGGNELTPTHIIQPSRSGHILILLGFHQPSDTPQGAWDLQVATER